MVFDLGVPGGVAGMYGLCAIRQGGEEFQEALEELRRIDQKHGSADVNCQLGLMELHAGNRESGGRTI